MKAFEMAGALSRQLNGRNFTRDYIKLAHNNAVELMVSASTNYLCVEITKI